MPLPIRDGNQSLTTLSTLIVNSAHVPAHTVVSLGSQAISDIAQAVSGVELGPNTINALENISVTFGSGASVTIGNVVSVTGGLTDAQLRASSVTIGGSVQVSNFPATQSVTFSSPTITGSVSVLNLPATQTVTFTEASVTFGTAVVTGSVSVLNLPATQAVTFTQASVTFGQAVVSASNIGDLISSVATDNTLDATTKFVKIGGHQSGSNQTSHIVHVSAGGSMSVDASGSSVTFTEASVTFSSITGSVSVLNFPATQTTTFSAITGSVSVLNLPATQTVTFTEASVTFGTPVVTGSVSVSNFPSTQTISGTVTANGFDFNNSSYEPIPLAPFDENASGGRAVVAKIVDDSGVGLNFSVGVPISGTVTANNLPLVGENFSSTTLGAVRSALYIKDTLGGSGFVGIGNDADEGLPVRVNGTALPISGTVTANGGDFAGTNGTTPPAKVVPIGYIDTIGTGNLQQVGTDGGEGLPTRIKETYIDGVGYRNLPTWMDGSSFFDVPIAGTVTANVGIASESDVTQFGEWIANGFSAAQPTIAVIGTSGGQPFPISGTVTANANNFGFEPSEDLSVFGKKGIVVGYEDESSGEYRRVRDNQPLPVTINPAGAIPVISGTVTANNPSGALTTRFGSVTTANTAQITSAVTNTSRKYLLAQNISAGTVTIGIGFSPTTTQGIQLTAGGGLTFDAFCPTGAVYWLGAVTGAAFTILEG